LGESFQIYSQEETLGGRSDCPSLQVAGTGQRPRPAGYAHARGQVFKDFELVAQRRRGFHYQEEEQRGGGRREEQGKFQRQIRPAGGYGAHRGESGNRPTFTKRDVKTIMSDYD